MDVYLLLGEEKTAMFHSMLYLPVFLLVLLTSPHSSPQSGCCTGDSTWKDGCLLLGEEKTAMFHSMLFLPVLLPVLSSCPRLAVALSQGVALENFLLLFLLAKNKQYFPALPKTATAKIKQEAITKYSRSAQHFTLFSPSVPLLLLKKESSGGLGLGTAPWDSTVLLTLVLTLTLALAFLSYQMPPNTVLSGSMTVASHSVETLQKKKYGLSPSLCVVATS
jgi:hypothetical protein